MSSPTMPNTCVFGLSWGDEGKGKLVDLLCSNFDVVVRFNGGANAGHTVCIGDQKFALHLLPTGVLRKDTTGVIGPGVVVDPITLLEEIDGLAQRGMDVTGRLRISDRAHLVLAYHKIEDRLSEGAATDTARIGTTARGIGPCYADKMKRSTAIRFNDLIHDPGLDERVRAIVASRKAALLAMYGDDGGLYADRVIADIATARSRLGELVGNTTEFLQQTMDSGRAVLFEGANGMLLDVNHGTYPFVTSSNTGPHGIGPGAGIPAARVTRSIGVAKAYATRVGAGPFVSELHDETGERIRQAGHEFGTTTGRPRRCGWFDAVSCRYSAQRSGATDVALMHLDTLSGFEEVGVCVAYRVDGHTYDTVMADATLLARAEPVVEMVPGWKENLREVRQFEDLPAAARSYVQRIESLVHVPVSIVGVGPERAQTLARGDLQNMLEPAGDSAP